MMDLYAWGTTNGRRALIMAEEAGLPFTLHQVDIRNGQQLTPEYERINPYRKIPALVDPDGPGGKPATVFESAAICFYLADKTGRFMGSAADRPNVLKWSMFHATNVLAALSQVREGDNPKVEKRCEEILDTMNRHLAGRDWFADEYSIADVIPYTRIAGLSHERVKVSNHPNVAKWLDRAGSRPAVAKAMAQKFG